jgi:succinyl-diaminopimelate desuccinylase
MSTQVLQHIDPEAIAADTLDYLRVKSETGDEGEGSHFLARLLEREGFDVEIDEFLSGRPNVYSRVPGSGNGPTLLFNGHTDTIPIGVSTPPGRDGEWVVGRGAEDMKGGLVAMVHAMSALRKAGVTLKGDVWMTGVVGHEAPTGKKEGPKRLIQLLNDGEMAADACLIIEGPRKIWAASLGSTIFEITITSPRGAMHTLYVPYAENPALWAGKLLTRLEDFERRFELREPHPLCGRERVNVGIVRGGDYMNRLPTPLLVSGQRRWLPGTTVHDVHGELQALCDELAAESGLEFMLNLEGAREPFETPEEHPLHRTLDSAVTELTGTPPERIGMALVGDANLYANDARLPTVYYGPAHKTAHSDDERVRVEDLAHCAQVYALTAMRFCDIA